MKMAGLTEMKPEATKLQIARIVQTVKKTQKEKQKR